MLIRIRQLGQKIAEIPKKYPILVKLYVIFSWLSIFALIYSLIFIEDSRKIFVQFLWSYYVLWQFFILARSKTLPWKIYIRFFLVGVWLVAPLLALFMMGIHEITGGDPYDLWSQAIVTPLIEEFFKLLPLIFFLLLFQRAKTISLADFALIGAATGAGFQFAEETLRRLTVFGYSFSPLSGGDVIHWDFFTLFPGYFEESLFPTRMTVSHAVATALVTLAIGYAVRLKSKIGYASYIIPVFFFLWCYLDHSAWNSFGRFYDWVYEIHDWIGNGYYTKPVFLLLLLIAIIYDYIKLNSIRAKLPLLEREYVIEPVTEFIDLLFSLLGDRKRYKYLLVFFRDRRELGFRYLYGNLDDYTEIEKLKVRTAEFQKQLAVMLTILFILSVSLTGAVVSVIHAVHDPVCLACVFEDIGNWWDGLDPIDQIAIMGSLFAISLLFTGPWGALTFALTVGDLLGMAREFGSFLRNPRAWLAGLTRMGPKEALAYGIEAGLNRIPEVKIGKKFGELLKHGSGKKADDFIQKFAGSGERRYEPSPKHDPQSGWGSPNPIKDHETGQKLLDSAYSSSKTKQLYNVYEGKLIKFQPDTNGGWHPYEVQNPAKEVPSDVLRQMLKDGVIDKPTYKKWIKNK